MAPPISFDRYGLTGNPFRDLISETAGDAEVYHVNLDVDVPLQRIKDEVLDKENRAMVAIVGAIGAGKTERLRLALAESQRRKTKAIFVSITPTAAKNWKDIADGIVAATEIGGFSRIFNPPKWLRGVTTLQAAGKKPVESKVAAAAIGEALNGMAPAFLLLNDLHNLTPQTEIDRFALFLQELNDVIKPGVLVMFGCYANFFLALGTKHPALASRVSRTITLPTLTDEQASLLIAKKLLGKRIVEALDPLFPFDNEAIQILNKGSFGNPRKLLELADLALEQGIANRNYRIDGEVALASLEARRRAEAQAVAAAPAATEPHPPPAGHRPPASPPPRKAASTPASTAAAVARPDYLED